MMHPQTTKCTLRTMLSARSTSRMTRARCTWASTGEKSASWEKSKERKKHGEKNAKREKNKERKRQGVKKAMWEKGKVFDINDNVCLLINVFFFNSSLWYPSNHQSTIVHGPRADFRCMGVIRPESSPHVFLLPKTLYLKKKSGGHLSVVALRGP